MAVPVYSSKNDSISRTQGGPAARLKVPSLRSSVEAFKKAPKATRARLDAVAILSGATNLSGIACVVGVVFADAPSFDDPQLSLHGPGFQLSDDAPQCRAD